MSGYNIDIADMQCSVFRMAQSKWKMSPSDCALFDFDSEIWKESSYLLSLYDYCTSKKLCASGSSPHSKMLHSALSPKSNPCQNILPNQDYSITEK